MTNYNWLKLEGSNQTVEGKLYGPPEGKELVIYQPGFPGGAAHDLEEWHMPGLLIDGRSIFTLRHNGTILDGKHSAYYINCPERLERAKKQNEHVTGQSNGRPASLSTWLDEPLNVLEMLAPNFEQVILCGHSFGCLSLAWSLLTASKDMTKKVKRVVFLAGALGRMRSGNLSDPALVEWRHNLDSDWIRERVEVGSVEENLQTLLLASNKIHFEIDKFPAHIEPILLHPWGDTACSIDARLHVQESIDFLLSLNRGSLIVDKTQENVEGKGVVHDLPNLKTEFLKQLLDLSFVPKSKIFAYTGQEIT